ncbi:hypothetical protein D3C80_1667260 [compost metagenome]
MDVQFGTGGKTLDVAFELAGAEQKAQPCGFALGAGAATGEGGNALGHQLDADPGRQAAVEAIEQAARAHGQAGLNLLLIEGFDRIDQDHVAGMGQKFGQGPGDHDASPSIRLTLLPPKANELLISRRGPAAGRRWLASIRFSAGSCGSIAPSQT